MTGEFPTPDEDVPQDPAIPGKDVMSDASDAPLPDVKDASAEDRERMDDADDEGHMSSPDS
jgi:hypothetical protein